MTTEEPLFRHLWRTGELSRRVEAANEALSHCSLCGHACNVNRLEGELGTCSTGSVARVYCAVPHYGEEMPLIGWRGSGTIFFSNCNLRCQFCQNHELSHRGLGEDVDAERLARKMLHLQDEGCHNINLVSPTHVAPMILAALNIAAEHGLRLPIVYNTGGYDSMDVLRLLDGCIDIYMPDMKCADPAIAERLCHARDYPAVNRAAVKEMHRQVGVLRFKENGLAFRGLLVRHLVMPQKLAGTRDIMRFLAREVSPRTYLHLMNQYTPPSCQPLDKELCRCTTVSEYQEALAEVAEAGLQVHDLQYAH